MKKAVYAAVIGILAMGAGCSTNPTQSTVDTSTSGSGQTKTYENSLYRFGFKYPSNAKESVPALGNLDEKVVQIDLPTDLYPSTNLSEAQFIVTALPLAELNDCLTLDLPNTSLRFDTKKTINGLDYYMAQTSDAGAGNFYESHLYRTLQDNECFEFEQLIHTTNVQNYPEGTVTEVDKAPVWQSLDAIVNSVTFKE